MPRGLTRISHFDRPDPGRKLGGLGPGTFPAQRQRAHVSLQQTQPEQEGDHAASKQTLPISFNEEGRLMLFGIEAVPEVWAIALVYFVQGILGISRLAGKLRVARACQIGAAGEEGREGERRVGGRERTRKKVRMHARVFSLSHTQTHTCVSCLANGQRMQKNACPALPTAEDCE